MKKTLSAGGVVVNSRGDVLVVSQNGNSWSLPKGHIDPGEEPLAAAKREIAEESGIQTLRLLEDLGQYSRYRIGLNGEDELSELKTMRMYLFQTDEEALSPTDPDNPEARWVLPSKVAELLTHPKDKEFFLGVMHRLPRP